MQDHQKSNTDTQARTPEQQRYIELAAESKKLYHIQKSLDDMQAQIGQGNDAAAMLTVGYRLSQTLHAIKDMADTKYAQKKAMEVDNPALKAEAIEYGKQQQEKREQHKQHAQTQSF